MTIDLDDLKAKAAAATQGEWKFCREDRDSHVENLNAGVGAFKDLDYVAEPVWYEDHATIEVSPEDQAYITAAQPKTMLTLAAEVERLRDGMTIISNLYGEEKKTCCRIADTYLNGGEWR